MQTTLEPEEELLETEALDRWETLSARHRGQDGRLPEGFRYEDGQAPENREGEVM